MKMKALIWVAVAQLCLTGVFGGESCGKAIEEETACKYPSSLTLVSSPDKRRVDSDNCDAEYNKADWQEEPTVAYLEAKPDKTYVLVNVDPDPPGYRKGQYWLHWLVSNIKGEDFVKGDLSKADHLTSYYGPAPPSGSGLHRYMFLAFEEENGAMKVENPESRSRFELGSWLEKNRNLCGPVAGVQFRTKF